MKKILVLMLCAMIMIVAQVTNAQDDLTIDRQFRLFTSQNAQGYFKPMFTTLGQSFNTSLLNTAYVVNDWSLGLDISFMGMLIPDDQKFYDAELPDQFGIVSVTDNAMLKEGTVTRQLKGFVRQPTIYGGISHPVFAAPQSNFPPDSFYKTVTYAEGNNISFMSGLPVIQLILGLPTRSQIRFRFLTAPVQDKSLTYLNFGLNQNLDQAFGIFEPNSPTSLSLTGAYAMLSRSKGIDISSYSAGLNISHKLDFGITFYGGAQFEGLSGTIEAVRDKSTSEEVINSPYSEIRNGENLKVNVESFTSFRLTGGFSFELGNLEVHADAGYASQPVLNLGATIWFFKPDEFFFKLEDIYPKEFKAETLITKREFFIPWKEPTTLAVAQYKPKVFALTASLGVFGRMGDIEYPLNKIKVEEFLSRQMKPLMPYIFFADNSSDIPTKYKTFTNSEETKSFSLTRLLGQTTLESYYDMLNIYGKRMQDNPDSKIVLSGYKSGKGAEAKNKNISKERVEKIRDYFVNIWKIDPARIKVESGNLPKRASNDNEPMGAEENRRVEIFSEDWEIMKPVDLQDTLRKVTPEKIIFKPSYESEAGLSNWNIRVDEGANNLQNYKEKGNPPAEIVWDFALDARAPRLKQKMNYFMEVNDKEKQKIKTETKEIDIEMLTIEEKRKNSTKDTIINVYNLILFDFNKFTLDPTNKRITDIIKSEIPQNAIVKVTGYTDIIGKDTYNLELSTKRAKSTSEALEFKDANYIGKGEYELLYDNSTPEGRYYCRTVVVEVRIPVN